MDDSGTNSTSHINQDNFTGNMNAQNINVDIDNLTHTTDNDAVANNLLNRNNFTARDHLFQAMFSRIALTYDRTFPPFARRFIEFMLLLTAISVLFILIYIHMAFVKAPITCLDHFAFNENVVRDSSDGSIKHMVIRVEVLSNPPSKYSLYHSYSKEYDDLNRMNQSDSVEVSKLSSSENFSHWLKFMNLIRKQCSRSYSGSEFYGEKYENGQSLVDGNKPNEKHGDESTDGILHRLFNFPINPILEKAEYWREKLSVRAMAPFRQTFNELELFAKSVFTEEKYIMEYSLEYGLLRLTPQTRERLNIPVHFVLLDANKDQCFGNGLSRFLLQEFVGYDQIIIGSLKRLAERQNGKGYVRNVVSGEHYRFVNSWMSRTSYLAAGFIMIIFTLSVSMLLRYSHHQIFVFIVDLLRMLENNLQFSFPAAPLLTVVLALVGMEAIMSEFFNDTSTAFYTILIIWLADQYEAVCCRTYVSKRHWPKYFYLYHFAFYAYHYRFNGQFSGLALLCSWLFIQHSMFFFFHHYELPRLMHGIAVRTIMDSLIVERADNTSRTQSSMFPNDDDDLDRSDGDRYDPDDDPGTSSNIPSMAASGEMMHDKNDNVNCQVDHEPGENHRTSSNYHSNNHQLSLIVDSSLFITKRCNLHSLISYSKRQSETSPFNSVTYCIKQLDKLLVHSKLHQSQLSLQKLKFSLNHFSKKNNGSKIINLYYRYRFNFPLKTLKITEFFPPKHLSYQDNSDESYSEIISTELQQFPSSSVTTICCLLRGFFGVILHLLSVLLPPQSLNIINPDNYYLIDSLLCQCSMSNIDSIEDQNRNKLNNRISNLDKSPDCCFHAMLSRELCKSPHNVNVSSNNFHQISYPECESSADLITPEIKPLISPRSSLDNLLNQTIVKVSEAVLSYDLFMGTEQGTWLDLGLDNIVV